MGKPVAIASMAALVAALLSVGCGGSVAVSASGSPASDGGPKDATTKPSPEAPYAICDQSDKLRLAVQRFPPRLNLGGNLQGQNGYGYLFVDGACRYWVYGAEQHGWQATHSGVLSAGEAVELSTDLDAAHWSNLFEGGPCSDMPLVYAYRAGVHLYGTPCIANGIISSIQATAGQWIDRLWHESTAVKGPLRAFAVTMVGYQALYAKYQWPTTTLGFDLGAITISSNQASESGFNDMAPLVTDPAIITELRQQRERVIAGDYLKFSNGDSDYELPVVQNDTFYFVFIRDTIPLEDANGLIRP